MNLQLNLSRGAYGLRRFDSVGLGALAETCDSLALPYRFFGFDSAISEVVNYAKGIDDWMTAGGRAEIAAKLGIKPDTKQSA